MALYVTGPTVRKKCFADASLATVDGPASAKKLSAQEEPHEEPQRDRTTIRYQNFVGGDRY